MTTYQLVDPVYTAEADLSILDRLGHLHGPNGKFIPKGDIGVSVGGNHRGERVPLHREVFSSSSRTTTTTDSQGNSSIDYEAVTQSLSRLQDGSLSHEEAVREHTRISAELNKVRGLTVKLEHEKTKAERTIETGKEYAHTMAVSQVAHHVALVGSQLLASAGAYVGANEAFSELFNKFAENPFGESAIHVVSAALISALVVAMNKLVKKIRAHAAREAAKHKAE